VEVGLPVNVPQQGCDFLVISQLVCQLFFEMFNWLSTIAYR